MHDRVENPHWYRHNPGAGVAQSHCSKIEYMLDTIIANPPKDGDAKPWI